MPHMTDEEWGGVMGVASATEGTMYRHALEAWHEWNPEWVVDRVNGRLGSSRSFEIDQLMRAFMEAYLQGVERKLSGGSDD